MSSKGRNPLDVGAEIRRDALEISLADRCNRVVEGLLIRGYVSSSEGVLLKLTGGPDVKAFLGTYLIQKA